MPFTANHWNSMDADLRLHAKHTHHANILPMDDVRIHLGLRDAMLTLDPIAFDMAGGHIQATIALNGRASPIAARADIHARKVLLSKLFPKMVLSETSLGEINGDIALSGNGNSVGRMLAHANGKLGLVVGHGEVSKLMMEKVGLHLWEMLALTLSGDKPIELRCGIADFDVKNGLMAVNALVFDTEVTTLLGSGHIDLANEELDLTLNQRTKRTSPLALRSPILVHGSFANPTVGVNKSRLAARAVGSVALALINPLLAIVPLVDPGPGADTDCAHLFNEARSQKKDTPQ